jgi:hypothetical protein
MGALAGTERRAGCRARALWFNSQRGGLPRLPVPFAPFHSWFCEWGWGWGSCHLGFNCNHSRLHSWYHQPLGHFAPLEPN